MIFAKMLAEENENEEEKADNRNERDRQNGGRKPLGQSSVKKSQE